MIACQNPQNVKIVDDLVMGGAEINKMTSPGLSPLR